MDISIKNSNINESTLIWAIVCSFLLHALLAILIPNIKLYAPEKPIQLEIEIQKAIKPEPAAIQPEQPAEKAEEPKPEVKKPEPIKKITEPKPITKTVKAPSPVTEVEQTTPPVEAPSPNVIAVEPTPNTAPVAVVAPPAPPAPQVVTAPERSQVEIDDALGEYGNLLGRAIAKHKQYPRIAQTRGWEGNVLLDLKLDGNGQVLSATIRQGSGYEALDKQALEMVRKASPFPAPPEALRNRTFNITVPVSFKLE